MPIIAQPPATTPYPRAAAWLAANPPVSAWDDLTDRAKDKLAADHAAARLAGASPDRTPIQRWLATDRRPPLTAEAEANLAARARTDPAARAELIERNILLAYAITKHDPPVHRSNRRQDALIALTEAADNYDPARGRFTTWAWHVMAWHLARSRAADRLIPIPPEQARKLARLDREFDADWLARRPADRDRAREARDLAAELGLTPAALDRLRQLPHAEPADPTPADADDAPPRLDALAAHAALRAEAAADRAESAARRAEAAADVLDRLTPNERKVMECWAAEPGRHAADVARELGMAEHQVYGYRRRAKARLRDDHDIAA